MFRIRSFSASKRVAVGVKVKVKVKADPAKKAAAAAAAKKPAAKPKAAGYFSLLAMFDAIAIVGGLARFVAVVEE